MRLDELREEAAREARARRFVSLEVAALAAADVAPSDRAIFLAEAAAARVAVPARPTRRPRASLRPDPSIPPCRRSGNASSVCTTRARVRIPTRSRGVPRTPRRIPGRARPGGPAARYSAHPRVRRRQGARATHRATRAPSAGIRSRGRSVQTPGPRCGRARMETIARGGGDDEGGGDRGGVATRAPPRRGRSRGRPRRDALGGRVEREGRREEGRHRTAGTRRGDARTRGGRRANARSNPPPVRATPPTPPTAPARPRPRGCPRIRPRIRPRRQPRIRPRRQPGSARVATLVATLASLGPVACRPPVDDGGGARGSTPVQTGPAVRGVSHARRGVLRRRGRPSLGRLGRAREGRRGLF